MALENADVVESNIYGFNCLRFIVADSLGNVQWRNGRNHRRFILFNDFVMWTLDVWTRRWRRVHTWFSQREEFIVNINQLIEFLCVRNFSHHDIVEVLCEHSASYYLSYTELCELAYAATLARDSAAELERQAIEAENTALKQCE